MARLKLETLAATCRLGALIARLAQAGRMPPILLRGALGSGKTALAAAIVRHLPGGEEAEVSSPSFTLCNFYAVKPPVLHCDLYRCGGNVPEEVWEFENEGLLLVEWGEYMQPPPEEFLDISLNVVNDVRLALISGYGHAGLELEKRIEALWPEAADCA